jgi:hypothetical protein
VGVIFSTPRDAREGGDDADSRNERDRVTIGDEGVGDARAGGDDVEDERRDEAGRTRTRTRRARDDHDDDDDVDAR